jgi:hypothetical protein
LQDDFTELLRTPLAVQGGRFDADLSRCPPRLKQAIVDDARAGADARLAVYQRQYWLRLFSVMQGELLLTSRLIGAFTFNRLACRFLLDRPPQHADLGRIVEGFEPWLLRHRAWLARLQAPPPLDAVLQAVKVDMAFRRAWLAPLQPAWSPSAEEGASLAMRRLRLADHATLIDESWPLVAMRMDLVRDPSPEQVSLASPARRHWAILRTDKGFGQLRLEPRQAQLYRECTRRPLQDALATLQRSAQGREQGEDASKVQQWFAQGVALGLWSGVEP